MLKLRFYCEGKRVPQEAKVEAPSMPNIAIAGPPVQSQDYSCGQPEGWGGGAAEPNPRR